MPKFHNSSASPAAVLATFKHAQLLLLCLFFLGTGMSQSSVVARRRFTIESKILKQSRLTRNHTIWDNWHPVRGNKPKKLSKIYGKTNPWSFTMNTYIYIPPDMMYVPTIFIYQKNCTKPCRICPMSPPSQFKKSLNWKPNLPYFLVIPQVTISPHDIESLFWRSQNCFFQPKDSNKLILSESCGKQKKKCPIALTNLSWRINPPCGENLWRHMSRWKWLRRGAVPCQRSKKQPRRRPTRPQRKDGQHLRLQWKKPAIFPNHNVKNLH